MNRGIYFFSALLTIFFLLLTIATLLASYISANEFLSHFSIFVVFFPVLFVADLLLLLHWAINGKFRMALVVFLVISASIPSIANIFSFKPDFETQNNNGGVNILSFNVKFFNFSNEQCRKVLNYVNATKADIVCMQEFGYYLSGKLSLEFITGMLASYPYMHISTGSGTPKGLQKHVVTFSKHKIIRRNEIDLQSDYHRAIETYILAGRDTLRVVNCYLESNKLTVDEKNLYGNGDGQLQSIYRKLARASIVRCRQAERVAEAVGDSPEATIVCGDMNDVPNSKSYKLIRGNMNDSFLSLRRGFGYTFHEGIYNYRIDYIFASKDLELLNFSLDKQNLSDHYPILLHFDFKE